MKKHLLLKVVGLLLLVSWSFSARAEIKVGAPFALTGSISELAKGMQAGAALAMKQVNEQGGVLDQEYKLIFADSACDPSKAVDVVTHLIEEVGVSALVGPICSGATLRQARSVSIPAGVVTLAVASASSLITRLRDNDLVFRTTASDTYTGEVMAQYVLARGIKDIAISFASDAYNTGIARVFSEAFKAGGGNISVYQAHQPDRPDYINEAAALLAGSKNLALFAYYGSSGISLLKNAFATGKVDQLFATGGMLSDQTIAELGAEKLASTTILNNSSDESREAFKIWQKFAGDAEIPAKGPFVANAYDVAFMMALAIQSAGSADRKGISAALRAIAGPEGEVIFPGEFKKAKRLLSEGKKINYEGGSGSLDFDENGDVLGFFSVNRVKEGQWDSQPFPQ